MAKGNPRKNTQFICLACGRQRTTTNPVPYCCGRIMAKKE